MQSKFQHQYQSQSVDCILHEYIIVLEFFMKNLSNSVRNLETEWFQYEHGATEWDSASAKCPGKLANANPLGLG